MWLLESHQVLPYVVCAQVRRHVHKWIRRKRHGEENPGHFVFGKPVFFILGLGLTTPYSLGVLVWNFYHTFVTMSIGFWLRFEAQIRPTRWAINFLLITAKAERKVRLCVNWLIFFVGEYSSIWLEIFRVLSQIQWRFLRWISGINYFGRIFRKFRGNQGYILYQNLWNFALLSTFFILGRYCAERVHTSTSICCLRRGKQARP